MLKKVVLLNIFVETIIINDIFDQLNASLFKKFNKLMIPNIWTIVYI